MSFREKHIQLHKSKSSQELVLKCSWARLKPIFGKAGKPGNPKKNSRSKDENQTTNSTHMYDMHLLSRLLHFLSWIKKRLFYCQLTVSNDNSSVGKFIYHYLSCRNYSPHPPRQCFLLHYFNIFCSPVQVYWKSWFKATWQPTCTVTGWTRTRGPYNLFWEGESFRNLLEQRNNMKT